MVSDRVGDFIIRLKNAGAIGNQVVSTPYSKHLEAIANKLKDLGFIERLCLEQLLRGAVEQGTVALKDPH